MRLSERAESWLRTLRREAYLPTIDVERLLRDAGATPHAAWLELHDRFAGYVESVGPDDEAVWGLASPSAGPRPARWRPPNHVYVIPGTDECPESIACADANPVHQYELGADGWFSGIGGPCPSFAMKIERHGLVHDIFSRGSVTRTLYGKRADPGIRERLLKETNGFLVPEASTADAELYSSPTRLVRWHPGISQLVLYELQR